MDLRSQEPGDEPAIHALLLAAFGDAEGREISKLVSELLGDDSARPLRAWVAAIGSRIVGYVLFTRATVDPSKRDISAAILAPLAVHPEFQSRGIGGKLIEIGLENLAEQGIDLVFVLGHPSYYPRHGFQPAGALGLDAPYPIPAEHADAWMVLELSDGVLGYAQGTVRCARALDEPRHWQE